MLHKKPVPVYTGVDIPNVAKPFHKFLGGGTTAPKDASDIQRKYQVYPPHVQNTLKPFLSNNITNPSRLCKDVYSPDQNMVGRVCSTPGTDGPLYSREKEFVDGNANWVRGNRFGVKYPMTDKPRYTYIVPSLKTNNKLYYTPDQFYPIRNMENQKMYPHTYNYTKDGYPTWRYPYQLVENFEDKRKVGFWIVVFSTLIGLMCYSRK